MTFYLTNIYRGKKCQINDHVKLSSNSYIMGQNLINLNNLAVSSVGGCLLFGSPFQIQNSI